MCVCGQSLCLTDAPISRRHHVLLASGLSRHACSNWLSREKGDVRLSRGGKGFWRGVSFWCLEARLFRHAQIPLPVWGPLGNCYFCIYLFYFVFILFIYFKISNSFPAVAIVVVVVLSVVLLSCILIISWGVSSWCNG